MELTTIQTDSSSKEGLAVETSVRDFQLTSDEPEEMGGENQGPTPMELVLAGLGSCLGIMAKMSANKLQVNLEEVKVHVEGDFDRRAIGGKEDAKTGFQNIRATLDLRGNLSGTEKEKIIAKVEQACPVTDTLKSSTKLEIERG